jgi:hypothetical protein
MAGPSTLNVQSVKVTESGLVKENVASHGWFNRGWELSWNNKRRKVRLVGRARRRVRTAMGGCDKARNRLSAEPRAIFF